MPAKPDLTAFEALTELDELRKVASDLQAKLRQAKTKTADLVEAARQGAKEAWLLQGRPPAVPKPKPRSGKGSPEVALLHVSDWQLGKRTDSYNLEVGAARVDRLAQLLVKLVEIERADHPVDELHLLLGGDLVEGAQIFPGQQWEIDASLFEQVAAASAAVERLIRTALSCFERVEVWQVEGNHGRLGKKGDYPRVDNADLFVYEQTFERVTAQLTPGQTVVWHPRNSWYQIVQAGNYRALLVHGDQIKQFGGNTPAFGISRKVNSWAAGVLPEFTDAFLGHFHQPLVLPLANGKGRAFVNPSLESDSAYAQEFVAARGVPGQRLVFVDPRRGRVTTERLIWLDED